MRCGHSMFFSDGRAADQQKAMSRINLRNPIDLSNPHLYNAAFFGA